MSQPAIRPYRIVAAVDGSEQAESVVERALDLARREGAAEVHFLRVVEFQRHSLRDSERAIDAAHAEISALVRGGLDAFDGRRDELPNWRVRVHVLAGRPAEEILELAADVEADLIVLGRWGTKSRRWRRIGSVPRDVLAGASCPVLVTQPTDYGQHEWAPDSCDACLETRRSSEGEIWFCDQHADSGGFRSTTLISQAFTAVHGHVPR